MKAIIRYLKDLYSGPFQATLVISFTLVAALTIGMGSWVISSTIDNYLAEAMDERIARDIHLAETFYNIKLYQISGIASRLSLHPHVIDSIEAANQGNRLALEIIDEEIYNKGLGLTLGGNHFIVVLNVEGEVLAGRLITATGDQIPLRSGGNWSKLPIISQVLQQGVESASTEVIPEELLHQVGMADQARIELIDTPKAAHQPFDAREGRAALALVGVAPIWDDVQILGLALVFHMFNNDFNLVDQIKDAAQIDTATIFFGDLRVSTNVMTETGERAVGTRVSQEVSDIVLRGGQEYGGTAFVVNEDYITQYRPLYDHTGQVVGMLYTGARQESFLRLVNTFDQRVALVAVFMFFLTFMLATPVSRRITRPLKELRELSRASRRVAEGDLNARAPVTTGGEVGQLAGSFNNMLDTLQATQDQLVHKENLASLGQLAAGVAHELNNPLATVLLYADILKRECAEDDPRCADLETIVRETNRCKTIVAALLDFARQHQVEVQVLDLNALIQTIIEIESKHAIYEQVSIHTELAPDLPEIQADPAQLQAVFINLLSNAADAMPGGGAITIRTMSGPSGMVTIEIKDTGEGIAPENLPKVYTPFFTTKLIGKGTGLGLAITYGIIKMHRGQINVKSQVGEGTTFTIHLRLRLPNRGEAAQFPNHTSPDQDLIGG
jgi:two-component system NtrC family sensor kinase